jgi:hypothetical protein
MPTTRLIIITIIILIIVNYIAEVSNTCAAWSEEPCEAAYYG